MAVHDDASIASRGKVQSHVAIVFLTLAWFFTALRIITRTYVIKNFGWDDSTMIFAAVMFTVYCATMIYLNANGGGTHITSVPDLVELTKWTIVGEATYLVTIMILKISLGIFFARIVIKRWQLWTIYVTVAVNIISSMAAFFYVFFRCGADIDAYVYRQLANKCAPRGLDRFVAYQQASLTTLTDCVFATLPVLILWNASMDRKSKISVGFILSLAALGSICSMIRFQYVDGLTQIEDFFWNATNVAIWSTIEPGAGIIAGCLATLRPFLKRFLVNARSIGSSASRSTKNLSRSLRSHGNSSNQKTTPESQCKSHRGADPNDYPPHDQIIQLKSDVGQQRGSTDCIISGMDADGPWLSQYENSLDLERGSSKTNQSRGTLRPSLDRALPPLPTSLTERDNMV